MPVYYFITARISRFDMQRIVLSYLTPSSFFTSYWALFPISDSLFSCAIIGFDLLGCRLLSFLL